MIYKLANKKAIAEGGEKYIFQCPTDDKLLIKVWKERYYKLLLKRYPFIHKISRAPKYISLTNEVMEHIVLRGNNQDTKHIQDIIGICDTDMGLGIVVRAIKKCNGDLAPTLGDLIDSKLYEEEHRKQLNKFLVWLRETRVIIRDLTVNNIVWCEQKGLFVVIDGIGPRPLPSLRQVSALYNRRANNKRADKLLLRVDKRISVVNAEDVESH